MPYGVVPPRNAPSYSTVEINGVPARAHPVRLTIRSKIKLPDQLATFAPWGNNLSGRFEGSPEMKRSWKRRKVVYEGYITHTRLEGALRLIAEYSGVTATVVYL